MKTIDCEALKDYMAQENVDGWLLYDFRGSNAIFAEVLGEGRATSRRCFLLYRPSGEATVLVHHVDKHLFPDAETITYTSREELIRSLRTLLKGCRRLAMEYSRRCEIPTLSRVDAGTVELMKELGIRVVSSQNIYQGCVAAWTRDNLKTHYVAAEKILRIKDEAFEYVRRKLLENALVTERDVQAYIVNRFEDEGLVTEDEDDRPIVAVNENSSDPHCQPTEQRNTMIRAGDWLLIDLWARQAIPNACFADITWVCYLGRDVPSELTKVFDIVRSARDLAFEFLQNSWTKGRAIRGWEVDKVARDYVAKKGYDGYFTHRTGHSIGSRYLHGNGVNLDNYESKDTRLIGAGAAFSIEPGIYLKKFGVRSEVDVYVDTAGPVLTTGAQNKIVHCPELRT